MSKRLRRQPSNGSPGPPGAYATRRVVWVVDAPDQPTFGRSRAFAADLAREGLEVTGPGDTAPPQADVAVVMLRPGPENQERDRLVAAVAASGAEVWPLVLGTEPSAHYSDLSQMLLPEQAVPGATPWIARLLRSGSGTYTRVHALVARAQRWDSAGRRDADLADAPSLDDLGSLLRPAIEVRPDAQGLVTEYLHASRARLASRQRRQTAVLTLVSVLLVLASSAALVARQASAAAAARASHEAVVSTSTRLVRQAVALLDSENADPDLPGLLVAAALAQHPSTTAWEAARRVLETTPPHRSVKLTGVPAGVAAARDGSVLVVSYRDGSADLRDRNGGLTEKIAASDAEDSPVRAVISPDGARCALIGRTVRGIRGTPAQRGTHALPPGVRAITGQWRGETLTLVTDAGRFDLDEAGRLAPVRSWTVPPARKVRAADLAPDGRLAAVLNDGQIWLGDHQTGRTYHVLAAPSAGDVEFTPDGQYLYAVASIPSAVVSDGNQAWDVTDPSHPRVTTAPRGWLIPGPGDLILSQLSRDDVCPVVPAAGVVTDCIDTHRGGMAGAAGYGRSSVVTVGLDSYLRLWPTVDTPRYPAPDTADGYEDITSNVPLRQATRRSRIEIDPYAGTGTLLVYGSGSVVSFGLAELTGRATGFVGIPANQHELAVSPGGRFVARLAAGWLIVFRADSAERVWQRSDVLVGPPGVGLGTPLAVSADGRTVAAASDDRLVTWQASGPPSVLPLPGRASAGWLLGHGVMASMDQDGATSPNWRGLLPQGLSGKVLAVAADSSHMVVVTVDGRVLAADRAGWRALTTLEPGLAPYAARLSPQGTRVALFAPGQAIVLNLGDGQVLLHSRNPLKRGAVDDLAFLTEDRVITLERAQGLRVRELMPASSLGPALASALPRELTTEERDIYNVPDTGGR